MEQEYSIEKDNKLLYKIGIIIGVIILVTVIVVLIISNSNKKKTCNELYSSLKQEVMNYVKFNNLIPTINGDYVLINLDNLSNKLYVGNKVCSGNAKYTKKDDEYIITYNISGCNRCDTKENKWSRFSTNYNKTKENIDVVATFNYTNVSYYDTKWSNWYASEKISKEATNGVYLPIDEKLLPNVPTGGIIDEIIKEDETRYSYRDKKWKWYKNPYADYSDFSSTVPNGYENKDLATQIKTENTDWSMDYPEVKDYRVISTKTGYRWYKEEGKEKVYWKNGAYYPTAPSEEYKKDNNASVPMYSYYDKMWRWYNKEMRCYTGYNSEGSKTFSYKDSALYMYTGWSTYSTESKLNSANKSYREEKTDTYSRYLIKYKIKSMPILKEYLTKEDFEKQTGMTLKEIEQSKNYDLDVKFKYRYY